MKWLPTLTDAELARAIRLHAPGPGQNLLLREQRRRAVAAKAPATPPRSNPTP